MRNKTRTARAKPRPKPTRSSVPPERIDVASVAAGHLEAICLSLMQQSEPDEVHGTAPRPIPAVMLYEIAARGRDLAGVIMDALNDSCVPTDELRRVVRSTLGVYGPA